jgi:hypothetical protein
MVFVTVACACRVGVVFVVCVRAGVHGPGELCQDGASTGLRSG